MKKSVSKVVTSAMVLGGIVSGMTVVDPNIAHAETPTEVQVEVLESLMEEYGLDYGDNLDGVASEDAINVDEFVTEEAGEYEITSEDVELVEDAVEVSVFSGLPVFQNAPNEITIPVREHHVIQDVLAVLNEITARDAQGQAIPRQDIIHELGSLDPTRVGTYTIHIEVTDAHGNTTRQAILVRIVDGSGDSGSTATTHTVRAGDTLFSISRANGITVAQLREWNGLTSDIIRVGQVLNLTAPTTGTPAPPAPAPDAAGTHTVRAGDTLFNISQRTGVSVNNLRQWNNLTNDTIRVGQVLRLTAPAGGGPTTPTPDTNRQGTVNTANLNVRSGAGVSHGVIRTISQGTNVTILEESNGWFRIQAGNTTGWVNAQFITVTSGGTGGSGGGTTTPTPEATRQGRVNATSLNVRSGAGTNHGVIRTISNGTTVTILEENNGWFRIQVGNTTGWVNAQFITVTSGGAGGGTTTPTPDTTRQGQTTANLNVRTGAGTNHNIIRTLPNGTNLTILGESNGWFRIQSGNTTGWVSSEFVRITSNGSNNNNTVNRQGRVTATHLNVRAGAGTSHRILRSISNGTTVTILGESNGWFRIQTGNTTGWVSSQFIRVL